MKLFNIISEYAPNRLFLSIVTGSLAGASYSLLLPLILNSIGRRDQAFPSLEENEIEWLGFTISQPKAAGAFFMLCVFILLLRNFSHITMTRVSADLAASLRQKLYKKVLDCSIDRLEKLGSPKLLASITNDVAQVVGGAATLPSLLVNSVTVFALLSIVFYMNAEVFFFVIKAIAVGITFHTLIMYVGRRYFVRSRQGFDELHESIRGLIYGSKELKLAQHKRQDFYQSNLLANERQIVSNRKKAHTLVDFAAHAGEMLNFFIIGFVVFIFISDNNISNDELLAVVMVLLYIVSPLSIILSSMTPLTMARVSLDKLKAIKSQLPPEALNANVQTVAPWQQITFSQVQYQYGNEQGFHIGPVDLTLKKGELTFIIGGNGSGKSTLGKLMTTHYHAHQGTIEFGDTLLDENSLHAIRQQIGCIYSDYYLFDKVLGLDDPGIKDKVDHYLNKFNIAHKVSYDNGRFSTLSLSDGQKRRLALVIAMLEDKPVYLFDEWAADQDPMFREVFYYEILDELKRQNKVIIVISHDDRYYAVADKIYKMDNGQLQNITDEVKTPAKPHQPIEPTAELACP